MFDELPKNHFGAILADPPWHFAAWAPKRVSPSKRWGGRREPDYQTMKDGEILSLPVKSLAADDCLLFLWMCWPILKLAIDVIEAWGFEYKTCGFAWIKGNARQIEFFEEETYAPMGLGYWTRSNSEMCLLGTRGKPKRLNADVRQGIIAPRREHSRKPDGVHERIERLVAGPYLELFARQSRAGWTTWGNEKTKFDRVANVG